jgi:hypothetical protein
MDIITHIICCASPSSNFSILPVRTNVSLRAYHLCGTKQKLRKSPTHRSKWALYVRAGSSVLEEFGRRDVIVMRRRASVIVSNNDERLFSIGQ